MLKDKYEKSPSGLLYIAPTGYGKTLEVLKFIRNSKRGISAGVRTAEGER